MKSHWIVSKTNGEKVGTVKDVLIGTERLDETVLVSGGGRRRTAPSY